MELCDAEKAEIAANYLSTLSDLTSNSKLTINVLTMLAEESKDHGQIIVDTITQHIAKVLIYLHLYLYYTDTNRRPIDSITNTIDRMINGSRRMRAREKVW